MNISRTKNNISVTAISSVSLELILVPLKYIFIIPIKINTVSATRNNISGTNIMFSHTYIIFRPTYNEY